MNHYLPAASPAAGLAALATLAGLAATSAGHRRILLGVHGHSTVHLILKASIFYAV